MDGGRARPDRACRPDPWEAVSSSKRSCAECPGGVLELIDRRGGRESFVSARDPVSQLLPRRGHQRPDRTRRQCSYISALAVANLRGTAAAREERAWQAARIW